MTSCNCNIITCYITCKNNKKLLLEVNKKMKLMKVTFLTMLFALLLLPTVASPSVVESIATNVSTVPTFKATNNNRTLVIYTYESLLQWGDNPEQVYNAVFTEFGDRYGINVTVVRFKDAHTMLQRLIEERLNPQADIVIGLDDILAIKAKESGVLLPYTPANLSLIRSDLVDILDPEHYLVPYDYGLIALVYDTKYVNDTTYPQMSHLTFEDFLNKSLASQLIVEDPTQSSTGLGYLLWQLAIYEKVLNKSWTEWWNATYDKISIKGSWGDAYDEFLSKQSTRHIVVSYGTDGAYSYHFYNDTRYSATLVYANNSYYGWLQVEGIGIVNGTDNLNISKAFVNWFLSDEVQQYIPLNNWMYPANTHVKLPDAYKYAIDPSKVKVANTLLSKDEIKQNLDSWLITWLNVVSQTPESQKSLDIYYIAGGIIAIAVIGLFVIMLRRKRII